MAIPIIHNWETYFTNPHEGLGSSYERIILNQLLEQVCSTYQVSSALETPSFGFTGLSGINLAGMAKQGVSITLEDNNPHRLDLIRDLWQNTLQLPLHTQLNTDYSTLDYPDRSFDLAFNFSAMWFTSDLGAFISELCRVCKKAILICVPNTQGLGYRMQIKDYSPKLYPELHLNHIQPQSIIYLMGKAGWQLKSQGYIDCPPWPDIGMSKESFLNKHLHRHNKEERSESKCVSIVPYYRDQDPGFKQQMLKLSFVERLAPQWFKRYWAHHYHLLFIPSHEAKQ